MKGRLDMSAPVRAGRRLAAGLALAAAGLAGWASAADAAVTSSFSAGTLTVFGDNLDNNITISRDAAGKLLVNGGAVSVNGGTPTVANVALIQVFGQGGNDTVTLSEATGALPRANLFGGAGNDVLTGGSGTDMLFGQAGNDTLLGKGENDFLFGGIDNDTLTGGDADDQVFGESGNDRMIWNPGDDTDLNEGGDGTDTVEVNGGNGAEQFTTTANGTRVRFDRLNPAPFTIDVGTSENLTLNANGGNDSHSATGNLAALIKVTVDGGVGDDSLLGSNGADVLLGGDGNDFADGQQGNDTAFLGAANDTFQWDPGDGSDVVEGQDGTDKLVFNGSAIGERLTASANGGRVRFTRDVASIVMNLNDVEAIDANALGGIDTLTVDDLSGTDVSDLAANLGGAAGGGDAAPDNVVVNATAGDDVASVIGSTGNARVVGLAARVSASGVEAGSDRVTVNGLAGDDVLDASDLAATSALLTLNGGLGDDILVGGAGDDTLSGGDGEDVLIGGPGNDTVDGGTGADVDIQSAGSNSVKSAKEAGRKWLRVHGRVVKRKTVMTVGGEKHTLPRADLPQLKRDATMR
jgi:Ca2+-binding RTX toxin-like protein